jgi:hypothetical protein
LAAKFAFSCNLCRCKAVGDFRDAAWDTWTAPLGFPVMGIYQDGVGTGTAGRHKLNAVHP